MRSSPEARQFDLAALAVGIAALGVVAERQGFAWSDTRSWVPDLITGWTLAFLGLVAARRRSRGLAVLLLVAALAWYVGDFHASGPAWFGSLATYLAWVFLAPLIQLSLAPPAGRPPTPLAAVAIAATWIAVVTPWLDWSDSTTLAAALGVLSIVGGVETLRARRPARPAALGGLGALLLLVTWALAVPRLGRGLQPIAFDAGVALVGVWLVFAFRPKAALAERAIELDESTGTLSGALAQLLGDAGLRIGFPKSAGEFVDDFGRPVHLATPGQQLTELADATGPVGIVVHDPCVLATPADREALSIAVALAGTRARLREDLRLRAADITRSTLRLIRVGDDERLRLSTRLEAGTGRRLEEVAQLLAEARLAQNGEKELEGSLDRASRQVKSARLELTALAGGLGVPALVAGLRAALGELVATLPLDVEARVAELDCPREVAATIWFVCAEGVSNVLKHSGASRLVIEVRACAPGIQVLVEDDGRGGADASGSGLGGLRDRLAALGGSLQIETPPDGGTRLLASLPPVGAGA